MKYRLFIVGACLAVLLGAGCSETNNGTAQRSVKISGIQTMENEKANRDGVEGREFQLGEEEWKERLTPEQYQVLRQKGTERAFTGEYWNSKKEGMYVCAACENDLFSSTTKFDSGTGWPSFWAPASEQHVKTEEDRSLFSVRNEVLCGRCGSHLGHVFDDGPAPTNLRYCINSVALDLVEKKEKEEKTAP